MENCSNAITCLTELIIFWSGIVARRMRITARMGLKAFLHELTMALKRRVWTLIDADVRRR